MNTLPVNRLNHWLTQNTSAVSRGFLAVLFAFMAVYLFSLSIRMTDTDLWYHLAGGRYLLETGQLYSPTVISYLNLDRGFVNYFWGFQLMSYGTWSLMGEFGLVLLKGLLFITSAVLASLIILHGRSIREAQFLHLLVIGIIVAILCCRGLTLRPHLVSYAMIPAFIYILQCRRNWYPLLPLLTIIWVNTHGIEWVIGALICGAYFLQLLADYFTGDEDKPEMSGFIWISLCLPAMMLSPNHVHLVFAPFIHDSGIGDFIGELQTTSISAAISFSDGFTLNTLILALLFFVLLSLWAAIADLRNNIAPLVLAAGGLVLLTMAERFTWEWMLLSTPLIAIGLRDRETAPVQLPGITVLTAFLLLMPFTFWPAMRSGWETYPFDRHSLPYGTTQFIRQNNLEGRYLIAPSFAGYAEFELAPAVKIHMDMQFPPFTSQDFHEYISAILTPAGLKRYVDTWDPDMLGVRTGNKVFPDGTARQLGYVPVFFDKEVVLYVDREKYPDIAQKYEINAVNPFDPDQFRGDRIEEAIEELEALLAAVSMPDLRLSLIGLLVEQGQLNRAELYIAETMNEQPGTRTTSYFSGRIAHQRSDCPTAVTHYEQAISLSEDNAPIHRHAAECYFLMGDQRAAYQHFRAAINPYKDTSPDALTYYQFALSAIGVGEFEQARRLLIMISRFDPDSKLSPQIEALLSEIEGAT